MANSNEQSFSYNPNDSDDVDAISSNNLEEVEWTASEYIAHYKGLGWYVVLGLIVSFGVLIAAFLLQDVPSAIAVGVVGLTFGVFAARPPQELTYRIGQSGISIGQKTYSYEQLKSFSIVEEGHIRSIIITPLQRFALPVSMYYSPEDEGRITDALANYMPYEQRGYDAIDRLMRRIRF